jgi:hypothetical protein
VQSAWEATGIYPLNPDKVLSTIIRPKSPSPIDLIPVKTPSSARSLRRIHDRLRKTGKITEEAAILLRAGEKLATELEIVRYEN